MTAMCLSAQVRASPSRDPNARVEIPGEMELHYFKLRNVCQVVIFLSAEAASVYRHLINPTALTPLW